MWKSSATFNSIFPGNQQKGCISKTNHDASILETFYDISSKYLNALALVPPLAQKNKNKKERRAEKEEEEETWQRGG